MSEFKVFISYKHTDINGELTEDYHIAKSLYKELKNNSVSVFFSDESLFELGKSDYKKAIDNALNSAELMVVIGTKKEYLQSGWVEYEFETFYEDILSERKKNANIISYTKNINCSDLPRTLSRLQNYSVENVSVAKIVEYIVNVFDASFSGGKTTEDIIRKEEPLFFNKHKGSVYESDYRNEIERLKIQSKNAASFDKNTITEVLDNSDCNEKLCVLDVGSAYGFVAEDRFGHNPRIDKIICIDKNERVIERARILFAENEKMIFEVVDVESDGFVNQMKEILNNNHIEKIHLVFSALTLHHLKDPNKVLRNLRKLMVQGSHIILRGSDDGSKLCYPRYELMQKIIEMTTSAQGVSDRFNGRKIYTQLSNAGFKKIRIFSSMKDLSCFNYDDRELLFNESFAYRINYFYKQVEKEPDSPEAKKRLNQMKEYLEEFENLFYESNFWYCEYDYIGIAEK